MGVPFFDLLRGVLERTRLRLEEERKHQERVARSIEAEYEVLEDPPVPPTPPPSGEPSVTGR